MASVEQEDEEAEPEYKTSLSKEVEEILGYEEENNWREVDIWFADSFIKNRSSVENRKEDVLFLHTNLFDGELGENTTYNDDGTFNLPDRKARIIYSEAIGSSIENKEIELKEENISEDAKAIVGEYKETIEDSDLKERYGLEIEAGDDFYERLEYFQRERLQKRLDDGAETAYPLPLQ